MRIVKELWIHLRIYTKKLHDTILLSKPRIYYIFKMYEKMRLNFLTKTQIMHYGRNFNFRTTKFMMPNTRKIGCSLFLASIKKITRFWRS